MSRVYAAEVCAGNYIKGIKRFITLDLTAGDGTVDPELEWERNCSPGILALHARRTRKPLLAVLYEQKPATFDRLLGNLAANLPRLGYEFDNGVWRYGNLVKIQPVNASGGDGFKIDMIVHGDAVFLSNDPNAMTDWALRPGFAAAIEGRTTWFRSISTLGCNPAGLKRIDRVERDGWFDLLAEQEGSLPRHRDLFLAAIRKDEAQWAYLICEPVKWRAQLETDVAVEFASHGRDIDGAWFRTQPDRYEEIKQTLFLTKKERRAAA